MLSFLFLFHAEDGIRGLTVTGVQTCALPISKSRPTPRANVAISSSGGRASPESSECTWKSRSEERRVGKESRNRWSSNLRSTLHCRTRSKLSSHQRESLKDHSVLSAMPESSP